MNLWWFCLYPLCGAAMLLLLWLVFEWERADQRARVWEVIATDRLNRIRELEGVKALEEDAEVAQLDAIWELPVREPRA